MKKTIHTLLTAALFATANVSAMPVVAGEDPTAAPPAEAAYDPASDQIQDVYGPPPTTTVGQTTNVNVTTSTTSATNTGTSIIENLLTTTTTTVEILYGPTVPYNRLGDVNEDGDVDIFDLVALRKLLVSGQSRSFYSDNYADVNFDRKVNVADLVRLQQFLLGKIDSLNDGQWDFMRGKTIETVAANNDQDIETTTTTTIYNPVKETIVTLYGIAPSRDVRNQMINPNQTTETTAQQITPEEK